MGSTVLRFLPETVQVTRAPAGQAVLSFMADPVPTLLSRQSDLEVLSPHACMELLGCLQGTNVCMAAGEKHNLSVRGLFYGIGHQPNSGIYGDQLELDEAGYVKVPPAGCPLLCAGCWKLAQVRIGFRTH